jgi:hypothetical protein
MTLRGVDTAVFRRYPLECLDTVTSGLGLKEIVD